MHHSYSHGDHIALAHCTFYVWVNHQINQFFSLGLLVSPVGSLSATNKPNFVHCTLYSCNISIQQDGRFTLKHSSLFWGGSYHKSSNRLFFSPIHKDTCKSYICVSNERPFDVMTPFITKLLKKNYIY